ncbi:MAG: hypothetical protein CMM90_00800 [Rickettsiales bacterium]|nr:hypothetical protein [Rickettsiales bacterium]|tara:strand:- start:437 stop:1672 length:1236 start_codon:yes stop_codon:yes gene_type:complete
MRILHLNFSSKGGAGIGVLRLNEALKENNIDSYILNYDEFIEDKNINLFLRIFIKFNWKIKIIFKKVLIKLFVRLPNKESISLNFFNNFNLKKYLNKNKFDLVHLHWIGNEMISIKEIYSIKVPIIWTMHDMWPFCGAEHFTNETRHREGYSSESRSKNEKGFDLNKFIWWEKNKFLKKKKINIICPSLWMHKEVIRSSLFREKKSEILPYIINTKKWDFNLKTNNRVVNSMNKTVILFSATSSVNYRKGFNFLAEAINNFLDHSKYYLLVVGDKPKRFENVKIEKKFFGTIDSEKKIKDIYYSSDIFVMPSLFESFGQVFTEAGCFGLPSIAFKNTAASEIINHKDNGYLADYKSSEDLANGIKWANYAINNNKDFKKNNRERIIKNFSYENKIGEYVDFYQKIKKLNNS